MRRKLGIIHWALILSSIFLFKENSFGEEWKEFPKLKNSEKILPIKDTVWAIKSGNLLKFQGGNISDSFFQTDYSKDTLFRPLSLFANKNKLFVNGLVERHTSVGYFFSHTVYGLDLVFNIDHSKTEILYADDSLIFDREGKSIISWQKDKNEIVTDTFPFLNSPKFSSGFGGGPEIFITFFIPDKKGNIWLGTESHSDAGNALTGIHMFNLQTRSMTEFPGIKSGICCNSAAIDSSGKIYLATKSGLLVYANGKFENLTFGDPQFNPEITSLFVDSKNTIWFGDGRDQDKVFHISNLINGKLSIKKEFQSVPGLNGIIEIKEDWRGNIWFTGWNISAFAYNENHISIPTSIRQTNEKDKKFKKIFSNPYWQKSKYTLLGTRFIEKK